MDGELTPPLEPGDEQARLDALDRELATHFHELPKMVLDKSSSSSEMGYAIVEALTLHDEGQSHAAVQLLLRDVPADRLVGCLLGLLNGTLQRLEESPATLARRFHSL